MSVRESSPREDGILRTPVSGKSVWTRAELESDKSWLHILSPRDLAEIDAVIANLRRKRRTLETVTRRDFSFPTFDVFLKRFLWHDIADRGFGVIRGLPTNMYSEDEIGMLFWGIGMHMGVGVSQNAEGHLLGHVRSQGKDFHALNVRGYQTSHRLYFHCDPADVVGLLCLRRAKEGGVSSIVSGMAMYNAVLGEHPEFLPILYRGFHYDRRGEEANYQKPISEPQPVFAHIDGELSIRFAIMSITTARKKLGYPFTDEELAALNYVDSLTSRDDLCFQMMLEEGDMQFLNNYLVLHARSDYVDHDDPALWRHMLRLWIKVPGIRKLDLRLIDYDENSGWSRREGILPPDAPMPKLRDDPLFV